MRVRYISGHLMAETMPRSDGRDGSITNFGARGSAVQSNLTQIEILAGATF